MALATGLTPARSRSNRRRLRACRPLAGNYHFTTPRTSTRARRPRVLVALFTGNAAKGLEIFTKVLLADRSGQERSRIVPQTHHGVVQRVPAAALGVDLRRPCQAHRFDYETPPEETLRAFETTSYALARSSTGVSRVASGGDLRPPWRSRRRWDSTASSPISRSTACSTGSSKTADPDVRRTASARSCGSPMAQRGPERRALPASCHPPGSRATDKRLDLHPQTLE